MYTRPYSRRAAALAALLLGLTACRRSPESVEEYAARNAVVRYNQSLVEAYRASRADLLSGVATDAEISRVAAVISGLARQGLFMEARQTDFRVERIAVMGPDAGLESASVDTAEEWTYEHRSLASRDKAAQEKKLSYRLSYRLARSGGGWVVDQVVERSSAEARP